ncbi:MAG: hypothetical protein ED557_01675 [Balneola sp.]|nr:MAG: hypothetical protein ED557_01675 [Balneola sp.]
MEVSSLKEMYQKVNEKAHTVFVVPLIRYNFPKTDYLFLLYESLFSEYKILSISVFAHIRFAITPLFNRKTILHYHWVEFQDAKSLFGMPYKLLCIALYRLFGGKIVWTVHNLKPHDQKFLALHHTIHKWMAKISSVIHVHSKHQIPQVSDYYQQPKEKFVVLPHPVFPSEIKPQQEAIDKIRREYFLGTDMFKSPIFLIFGGISEYKGIQDVIDILKEQNEEFTLILAGYMKKGQEHVHRYIMQHTSQDERVKYIPRFIPEEHYPFLLSAADICVFNYNEILNSGGIQMALSYQRKIIAPMKPGLLDFKKHPLVSLFETKEELKELLSSTLSRG